MNNQELEAYDEFCGIPLPDGYQFEYKFGVTDDVTTEAETISSAFIPAASPSHHFDNGNGEASDDTFGIRSKGEGSSLVAVPPQTHHNKNVIEVEYEAPPTIKRFLEDTDNWCKLLMGPIGSGKSSGAVVHLIQAAFNQEPSPDGVRRTRFAVIRNEYPSLFSTTIQTIRDWVPEELGTVKKVNPPELWLRQNLADGTTIESQWIFLALDSENDNRKLLSLELTGGWINEAREIQQSAFEVLQGRISRYPGTRLGGPTYSFVILDSNPPDVTHWMAKLFRNPPKGYGAYFQPSGLSDEAENIEHLHPEYYSRLLSGKSKAYIESYIHGRFSPNFAGKPIYDNFDMGLHVLDKHPDVPRNSHLRIGLDFGLTPAAAIGMVEPDGSLIIVDELISTRSGTLQFGQALKLHLNEHYNSCTFEISGDPAGTQASQSDMRTPYDILAGLGIDAAPAVTNDFEIRINAVILMLSTYVNGHNWLRVSPRAEYLISAMAGGYCYRRLRISGSERFMDKPDKGPFSHIAEALQYLCMSFNPEEYCKVLQNAHDTGHNLHMAQLLRSPIDSLLSPTGFTHPLERKVITQVDHKGRRNFQR